jgi:hypothetical protein
MPDRVPLERHNRPPSARNRVRHPAGILSAIGPECCPAWPGTRSCDIGRRDIHLFAEVFEQIGWPTLEGVERSATHPEKSELQCYAESQ